MPFILAIAALASQAAAAQPQAVPAQSTQQIFDVASAAAEEGRCDDAIKGFELIEARPAIRKSDVATAAIAVRKGVCLIQLGRAGEAVSTIRDGARLLAGKGETFTNDVRTARLALGRVAFQRLDYVTAAEDFRAALEASAGTSRFEPLIYLARATAFDGGPQPLAYASEALAILKADGNATKQSIAGAQTVHARILMNQGRHKEAYAELKDSLRLQGGLDLRVDLADIVTRSDLAIAALLTGDRDGARTYLAYTGAGRMKDAPFAKAVNMSPPACGTAGLKPDDFAVVEFMLKEDGWVEGVAPIYTTGGREVALEFARAVSEWSWKPEDAKAVPELFRAATRVEMRCTSAEERPSIIAPLETEVLQWAGGSFTSGESEGDSAARTLPLVKEALRQAEASGDRRAAIRSLVWLGKSDVVPPKEQIAYLDHALLTGSAGGTPASVTTYIAFLKIWATQRRESEKNGRDKSARLAASRRSRQALRALLAAPAVAADPLNAATLRLLIAQPEYRLEPAPDADALLDAVIADSGLPPRSPLKVNALLQKASRAAAQGRLDLAQESFAQTGLSEQQCALIGISPAVRKSGASSSDFPVDALRMGFEGWVQVEFDVGADGRTVAPRATVAYPPMIFNDAALGIGRDTLYERSYRPEGGLACSAEQHTVVFRLPR